MQSSRNVDKNWFGGLIAALAVLMLAFSCASARAETILFDNGSSSGTAPGVNVYFADASNPASEAGDVFIPTTSGTANFIVFDGVYYNNGTPIAPPSSESFLISLYAVSSGAPTGTAQTSAILDLTRSAVATNTDGFTTYQYSGTLANTFSLDDTTSYYLGITNEETADDEFGVSVTDAPGPATSEFTDFFGTFDNNPNPISLAFTLGKVAAVPEPSTWAMFVIGALGLLVYGRTRRTRV